MNTYELAQEFRPLVKGKGRNNRVYDSDVMYFWEQHELTEHEMSEVLRRFLPKERVEELLQLGREGS